MLRLILIILRLERQSKAFKRLRVVFKVKVPEMLIAMFLTLLLTIVAATVMYFLEGTVQPDAFGSIPRAMWWAVVTVSTVG